jgi:hypothetical protein
MAQVHAIAATALVDRDGLLRGSLLRRVLKGFSASNYCIAPRLWQPDFCWDHNGVPLAFSMTLATYAGLFDGIKR